MKIWILNLLKSKTARAVLLIVIATAILITVAKYSWDAFQKPPTTVITVSTLKETVDHADLASAELDYRGIAVMYLDKEKVIVKSHILYSAHVKAGVDLKQVDFDIDEDNHIIRATLPSVWTKATVDNDVNLSFIPDRQKDRTELKDALLVCQEDAESEVQNAADLLQTAQDNAKSVIEGLLSPIITPQGYELQWIESDIG